MSKIQKLICALILLVAFYKCNRVDGQTLEMTPNTVTQLPKPFVADASFVASYDEDQQGLPYFTGCEKTVLVIRYDVAEDCLYWYDGSLTKRTVIHSPKCTYTETEGIMETVKIWQFETESGKMKVTKNGQGSVIEMRPYHSSVHKKIYYSLKTNL